MGKAELLSRLRLLLKGVAPDAQMILFGSEARGEAKHGSDIDLLILLEQDKVTPKDEDRITAPIYDLEIESGTIISPIVMTRKAWNDIKGQTIFYHNVMKDGVVL